MSNTKRTVQKNYKRDLSNIYEVNVVKTGYLYYCDMLLEKCLGMFEYNGLPPNLPPEQIEIRLMTKGYCGVFEDSNFGLVTSYGSLSGVDIYSQPTTFVYAQPQLGQGVKLISTDKKRFKTPQQGERGGKCVVIYNAMIDYYLPRVGLRDLIRRYARLLADIDSSVNICTVNTRATFLASAKNQTTGSTVNRVLKKIREGEFETIVEGSILDNFNTFPFEKTGNTNITQLLDAKKTIMSSFLQEIGVRSATEKRERMLTEEVSGDDQLLLINLEDMLNQRRKGVDMINKVFGTNITVSKNEEYDVELFETELTAPEEEGEGIDS